MYIGDFLDLDLLQQIQDLFSDATGLAAIAVDAQGNYITKGSNFTDFCMKYTRGCEEGARRCIKCDNECTGTYFCHAGLMDFSSDIIVNGEKMGAIIGGQVLPNEPELDKFRAIARELGINEERYVEALKKVPVRPEKNIRAAADMLGRVVNLLANMQYMEKLNAKKIDVFNTEIKTSMESIARARSITHELQKVAKTENILSINATIEAAHAGTAGVGFAVVAQEIGDLSRNATKLYGEIESLMSNIEASIDNIQNVGI